MITISNDPFVEVWNAKFKSHLNKYNTYQFNIPIKEHGYFHVKS